MFLLINAAAHLSMITARWDLDAVLNLCIDDGRPEPLQIHIAGQGRLDH
jgi:hypothetical protein